MGFSKLYYKIKSLIRRNSKPIMLLIVSHNSVWVACIFKDKGKDKDKDTLFQVNITHSLKKHVNTIIICK